MNLKTTAQWTGVYLTIGTVVFGLVLALLAALASLTSVFGGGVHSFEVMFSFVALGLLALFLRATRIG